MTSARAQLIERWRRSALVRNLLRLVLMVLVLQIAGAPEMGREVGWFGDDTDCCDTCPND